MLILENKTKQNLIFVTYCLTRPHVSHVQGLLGQRSAKLFCAFLVDDGDV